VPVKFAAYYFRIRPLQRKPVEHGIAEGVSHHGLVLAFDEDPRRIIVFYGEIDKTHPRFCGRVDAGGRQNIVVN
jgi:hypothetical protein